MVSLLSLEATNFKRLNLQHPLEFGKGITLITGDNESGKSTILDAILFALFTRTIRPSARPRDEDILQYRTNKLTLRLLFAVEDRTFLVERRVHRNRPNEAFLSERLPNGALQAIATKVNSVNEEISKLLGGLSFDELVASNVVAQKELNKIVTLKLHDRIGVVNAFLKLESFTDAAQKLSDEKRGIEGTPSYPGALPVAKQRLQDLERELEEWKAKKKELEDTQIRMTDLQKKTDEDRKEYQKSHELFIELETYQKQLAKRNQIASDLKNKKETGDEIKKELEGLGTKQTELASLSNELKKYEGINGLAATIDQLDTEADVLHSKQVQLQAKEGAPPMKPEELKRAYEEIQSHPGRIGIQQAQSIRQNAKTIMIISGVLALAGVALGLLVNWLLFFLVVAGVAGFGYATIQTGKASALMTRHTDYVAKIKSHEDRSAIYADYQNSLPTLRSQVGEARNQLSQHIDSIARYSEITRGISRDPLQIAHLIKTKFNEEKSQSAILSAKIEQLVRDLKGKPQLLKQESDLNGQITILQKEHDALTLPELPAGIRYSDELLTKVQTEDQKLHDLIVKNDAHIINMKETMEKLSKFVEEKKELPQKTDEQTRNVQGLERRLRVLDDARTGVDKTSESLRARVKPSVEYYMGTFLPSVTMNRYKAVQLDDDYRLSVWDAEAGEYRPREVFSGGTEDQLLFVMRLAFALALTPEAKGTRPEFLFLDEPLGSSDEIRRGEIVQLLKVELAQYFKQILLVSHVQGLEEDVDRVVRLEAGRISEEL
jgi:exonuclease SbcC